MKKVNDVNQKLHPKDIGTFLLENESVDVSQLLLRDKTILGFPAYWVANQILGRRKAKSKLPLWYSNINVEYPPLLNLEQCSSQATATLKFELVKQELKHFSNAADLTGGFGVDTFFLCQLFKRVDYVEPDSNLLEVAMHNHKILGQAEGIFYHQGTAENFIAKAKQKYDLIFLDPSRRSASNKKVFQLADCTPDVSALLRQLFECSNHILIKSSPLLDLQKGVQELKFASKIFVVAVENECKEVLFFCEKGFNGQPSIHAFNMNENEELSPAPFSFLQTEEKQADPEFSAPLNFLYEPHAAILKAGAFKLVATRLGLKKIHVNTHLYTSENLLSDFPGRVFMTLALIKPQPRELKQYFPDGMANILTRNYPLSVDQLRKNTKLKEGGEKFLIAFGGHKEKFHAVATRVS